MTEYEQNIEVMKDLRNRIDAVLHTNENSNTIAHPDAKKHLYVSLAKSVLRIVAGGFLVTGDFVVAGALFIVAEILGIAEELV